MTKPKRYKRYIPEFKREAIRRASEEGVTDAAVCAEQAISTRHLHRIHAHSYSRNGIYPGKSGDRHQ